jgi:putative membrane protein
MGTMMFWYGAHWAFWQASLMWLGMILFWGLVIWAVYALATNVARKNSEKNDTTSEARQILDERLARGEIDEAEFRRLCDLIGSRDCRTPAGTGGSR